MYLKHIDDIESLIFDLTVKSKLYGIVGKIWVMIEKVTLNLNSFRLLSSL
jgi:hypothetical protein